jgi:hypothetical protein
VAKSAVIETVVPDVLEKHITKVAEPLPHMEARTRGASDAELLGMSVGTSIHWSRHGSVAVVTENPNLRDPQDVKGFLLPKKDGTSAYTKPDIVCVVEAAYAAGAQIVVLFLDELLGTDPLMQKALADVLHTHRFGNFRLPAKTWVVAASNRQFDGASVGRALTHLMNRCSVIEVTMPIYNPTRPSDPGTWVTWAESAGLPGGILTFAQSNPADIQVERPPKEGQYSTLRSMTAAGRWMQQYKKIVGDDNPATLPLPSNPLLSPEQGEYASSKVASLVGPAVAIKLDEHNKRVTMAPKIADILRDPEGTFVPDRTDVRFITTHMLTSYMDVQNFGAIWKYATRLPLEMQALVAMKTTTKPGMRGMALNHPQLSQWVAAHAVMLGEVGSA